MNKKLQHEIMVKLLKISELINKIDIEREKEEPNYQYISSCIRQIKEAGNVNLLNYITLKNFTI